MIDVAKFTCDKESKTFTAEISELEHCMGRSIFTQVYSDAIDEGITLINNKTGHDTTWVVINKSCHDGDLLSWTLEPTTNTLIRFPNTANWKIVIYND